MNLKSKLEVNEYLRSVWNFTSATQVEKNNWKYKIPLITSPTSLIDREVKDTKTELKDIIRKISYTENNKIELITDSFIVSIFNADVLFINPLTKKEKWVSLRPVKGNEFFWSHGFIIDQKEYKSLYYKTEEYNELRSKTLSKKYGIENCRGAGQAIEVKKKIQQSLTERFGVHSFLCRGEHYDKIEKVMLDKYGVLNIIYQEDWRLKAYIKRRGFTPQDKIEMRLQKKEEAYLRKKAGVSKIEHEILLELDSIFKFTNCYYFGKSEKQIMVKKDKGYYKLDFYDFNTNLVIEINGDHWHCNPKKYNDDYIQPTTKKTAKEIREYDRIRKQYIINQLNCKYITIWTSEWFINKEDIISFIKTLLETKH